MAFDPVSYAMGKNASGGGGGGGDITVQSLSVNSNGSYTAPSGKAYSPVNVNVPNSYSASDEGKVVDNGALVAQTSDTVTQNGTVDTTLINSLTVNVAGVVSGTFSPTSDSQSVTLSDCIGCTNIVIYPTMAIIAPSKGRIHWGTVIIDSTCVATGSGNSSNSSWSLLSSWGETLDSTTGEVTITRDGYTNGGGFWTSGMTYAYRAW